MHRFPWSASLLGPLALSIGACSTPGSEPLPSAPAPAAPAATEPVPILEIPRPAPQADAWSAPAEDASPQANLAGVPAPVAARGASLRRQLDERMVTGFTLNDVESLRQVIEYLAAVTGLPLVVHPAAEAAVLDAGVVFDIRLSQPISARNLLSLIAELAGEDVGWTVRHGVVLVTTRERARGELALAFYDLRAMTAPLTDFAAPRIDRLYVSGYEDEDRFGGAVDVQRGLDEAQVEQLVRDHVAPGTWDEGGTSVYVANGILIVKHTSEVQRQVRVFLARLGY